MQKRKQWEVKSRLQLHSKTTTYIQSICAETPLIHGSMNYVFDFV